MALFLKRENQYLCGGVLVNNDTVITGLTILLIVFLISSHMNLMISAAHCLHNRGDSLKISDENILILLGSHNLSEKEEERLLRNASYSIIHKDWNPHGIRFTGDIAALKLSEPVNYTDAINPICLYDQLEDGALLKNASLGVIYGWGKNESEVLQTKPFKVEVPINDVYNCTVENPYIAHLVWNESICAGKISKGVCKGDSGSGLYVNISNRFYLRGIVSSSTVESCGKTSEAIFADAVAYQSFIGVSYLITNYGFSMSFIRTI